MPLDSLQKLFRFLCSEGLHEGSGLVRIQIVEHQMNCLGMRVLLEHIANETCKVGFLAMFLDLNESPPSLGLHRDECTARSSTLILVILLRRMTGASRFARTRVLEKLNRLLIQTDYRLAITGRFFVLVEDVLPPLSELRSKLRNAPSFFRQGFKSAAVSQSATSLLLRDSTMPRFVASSASKINVQRARPSGGSVQAKAMTCFC